MSRFLRFCAFLSVLFFATNVFASGYTCPSYKRYTSCNEGYYLNGTQAGNSCDPCPSGCACSGGTAQPDCSIRVTYNLNGGGGTTPSAKQCTSGVSCSLQSGATTSFYRAGYVFKGWSTSSTATSGSTTITVSSSTTVYAVWSKCGAGTYKTSSAQASAACSTCPEGYRSGSGTTAQGNCLASCEAGYAVVSEGGACTSIQDDYHVGMYTTSHTVKYGELSTLNRCPQGYIYNLGTTAQSNCRTLCSAGYAVLSVNDTCRKIDSMQGVYTPEHFVYYGDKSEIVSCPTGYQAGHGTTAKEECIASCEAGSAVVKEHAECTSIQTDDYLGKYTEAHTVKYGALSTLTMCQDWYQDGKGAKSQFGCIASCKAGYAVLGQGGPCTSIQNSTYKGKYITAHTVNYGGTSTIKDCPTDYQAGNGTTAQSNCTTSCSAGYAVLSAKSACTSIQNATYKGKYITAHSVKYGGTSTIKDCPTDYQAGNGTTAQSNCTTSCSAGYAVLSANGACTTIQNATYTGKYTTAHTVKYGATSTISTCPTNYQAGNGTTAKNECKIACSAGKAVLEANGACERIVDDPAYAGQYTDDHTVKYGEKTEILVCPDGYRDRKTGSESKSGCQARCPAGYAVINPGLGCVNIMNDEYTGQYTDEHYVKYEETSEIQMCPDDYRAGKGTKAISGCLADCPAGTRVASANAACSAVTSGNVYMLAHTVKYGSTSAAATSCPSGYTISGTTQSDHDAKADCKITCSAGTRVESADVSCSSISSSTGYYITGHTVSAGTTSPAATQCPANYRSGAGTTSQANCSLTTTAGKYVASPGAGETACVSPYYCPGGTTIKYGTGTTTGGNSACTGLGAIYTKSDAGASVSTKCYATTTAKKWVASAKATAESDCTAGYYCEGGTKVYYNSTGGRNNCTGATYSGSGAASCTNCPSGYTANTASNKTAASQCQISCAAGTQVATANAQCTTPSGNWYTTASQLVNYGSTSSVNACKVATNLFNPSDYDSLWAYISSSSTTVTAYDNNAIVWVPVEPNTTYIVSGMRGANTMTMANSASVPVVGGKYSNFVDPGSVGKGMLYTTSSDAKYLILMGLRSADGSTTSTRQSILDKNVANLQIFKASDGYGIVGNATTDHDAAKDCTITCGAGQYVATAGSACVNVGAGYYATGGTVAQGGTSNRTQCTTTSGWTTTTSTDKSTSYSACYQTQTPSGCASGTIKRTASSISGTTITYGSASVSTSLSAKANYYVSETACPVCTGLGSFYTTSAGGAIDSSKCYGTTTAGKYIKTQNSSTQETCPAGSYCPATTVYYGKYDTSGGRVGCGAGKYNASTGSSASSACANITAGCYGTSASTACPAVCGTNQYSTAGSSSCSSCPSDYKNSGTTAASHAGSASCIITVSGGYYIGTAGDNSSNWDTCAGGTYKAQHTVKYGDISSCGQCPANSYCPAGASAATACSTLASGFYPNSAEGSDAATDCKTNSLSGKYVASANATSATSCAAGTYKGSHQVNYGSTSSCGTCPANSYCTAGASAATACSTLASGFYPNSAAGSDAATDCKTNSLSGKYVASANATSATSCAAGTYKGAHQVNYGSTSSCDQCPANSYCTAGASAATACSTLASGFYPNSAAGSDAATDCKTNSLSGKYVASVNATSATSCAAGTYKGSHQVNYGSTSSCGTCPANSYCTAGASAATACSALASGFYPNSAAGSDASTDCYTNVIGGKYVASAKASSATSCAAGTFKGAHIVNYGSTSSCDSCALGSYSAAGADACTACQGGKTTSGTGKSSCDATCANNNNYDSTWATATWSDNAVANLCQIATCAGGSRYTSTQGAATGTLPSGYTQLAYLESTGTQYINTGVVGKSGISVDALFIANDTTSGSLFGNRMSGDTRFWPAMWFASSGTTRWDVTVNTDNFAGTFEANTLYRTSFFSDSNGWTFSVNGKLVSYGAGVNTSNTNHMYMFGINNNNSSTLQYPFKGKAYFANIYENGVLIKHLIPAKRDSDGALGMYDTVNNKFLVNAGSGKFVAGPAILKSQNTCTQCDAGTYSAGGTATSCETCANWTYSSAGATSCTACLAVPDAVGGVAWTKASGTGWDAFNDCVVTQTPANCASGSVKRTQSSASAWGSTTLVSTLKSNAGYYASTSATACTICPAGSYCAANATAATACATGSYTSATGKSACTACSAGKTTSGTGKSSCDATCSNASGVNAWSTPSWSANSVSNLCTVSTCSSSYYKSSNTCTSCSGLASGFYPNSDNGNSSGASACRTNSLSGKYVASANATSATPCANWTYKGSHTVNYGQTSSCSDCLAVPDAVSGVAWTKATGTGWTSFSNCAVTQTPVNCASGSVKRTQSSASAWGSTTLASTLKSNAGYYASTTATSCTICPAGSYCAANATSATACATGSYTSATGKSACTACSAGKTTSGTGKSSCDATCDNATGAHTWATPSWSANSVTNLCTVSKCNANTYYTATTGTGYKNTCTACGSNSSTSAGNTSTACTCTTGYTSTGSVSGATTSKSGCSLISDIACAIGEYVPASSTTCSACTAGYYCPSTAKTYSYSSSIQGRTACSDGTYQPDTGKTSCTPASKGYYVSGTAKTAQTACTGATYAANEGQSSCTQCPAATNNAANVSSYSYYYSGGVHTVRSGCQARFKSKTLDDGVMTAYACYVDSGADTYGVDGTSRTCWVNKSDLKCNGGYYNSTFNNSSTATQDTSNKTLTNLYANACKNVEAGYWSANDSLTRTACTSPLTTIGYGTGANEAEDCGRKLHAGANVIYLRSGERTSPSLRVKVGDTTFYGALSTSLSSPLKVKNGSTTYSVVNDWQ